jgi:hypothetical protein
MTILQKPPTIDDKALAAVDGTWRTAREIRTLLDEGYTIGSTRSALGKLADAGNVERRHDPDPRSGTIARYRRAA